MDNNPNNPMSELRLRLLVKEFARIRLRQRHYRVVGAEDFGTHWRVMIEYNVMQDGENLAQRHLFAINEYGMLIWERSC